LTKRSRNPRWITIPPPAVVGFTPLLDHFVAARWVTPWAPPTLRELFKDAAPQPFTSRRSSGPGRIDVYGYSDLDTAELERRAGAFGDVTLYEGFDWSSLAAKPIPLSPPVREGSTFTGITGIQ
jgi:hypothetical protein